MGKGGADRRSQPGTCYDICGEQTGRARSVNRVLIKAMDFFHPGDNFQQNVTSKSLRYGRPRSQQDQLKSCCDTLGKGSIFSCSPCRPPGQAQGPNFTRALSSFQYATQALLLLTHWPCAISSAPSVYSVEANDRDRVIQDRL